MRLAGGFTLDLENRKLDSSNLDVLPEIRRLFRPGSGIPAVMAKAKAMKPGQMVSLTIAAFIVTGVEIGLAVLMLKNAAPQHKMKISGAFALVALPGRFLPVNLRRRCAPLFLCEREVEFEELRDSVA